MAGIGVELRKLLRTQTYTGLARAYLDAAAISSGPWLLSMLVIALIGLPSLISGKAIGGIFPFTVSVSHIVALSLIFTGMVQLLYTRFVADRLFENRDHLVLPNLFGLLTVVTAVGGLLAVTAILLWFSGTSRLYRAEMVVGFVLLSNVWCLTVFLTGIKEYRRVLHCFALAYGLILLLTLVPSWRDLEALLGCFVLGQVVLVYTLLSVLVRNYPSGTLVSWEWADKSMTHRVLIPIGLLYNFGLFIDKFLFWYYPETSIPVIGPLRDSPAYDFPLFLAYFSMIPGLAVFLVRMETDFAERHEVFYNAVRNGETLAYIERLRGSMIDTARHGIFEILKIQGTCIVLLLFFGRTILNFLHAPLPYLPLFNLDLIAVGSQVLLLAVLNTLFYLDKLGTALFLCAMFALSNLVLTWITLLLGPDFYGYGYAVSAAATSVVGLALLSRKMERLTFETFMFQPGPTGVALDEAPRRSSRRARRDRRMA